MPAAVQPQAHREGPPLVVYGTVRGRTGYDHHTRALVHQLLARGVRIRLYPLDSWMPEASRLGEEDQDRRLLSLTRAVPTRATLQFCVPPRGRPIPGCLNILHSMYEAELLPEPWLRRSLGFDFVAVPTESSRRAWIGTGFPEERLLLSPLGVDAERFHPGAPPLDIRLPDGAPLASRRVRFLNVSDVLLRKNLVALFAVWCAATRPDDDAALIVKLSAGAEDMVRAFDAEVAAGLARLGRRLADAAPVVLLRGTLPMAAMPGLFSAATHYLSVSHGEGWDLPAMEAAATGLRLIVPRHSAYADNLTDAVATLLPVRSVPAPRMTRWWEPDPDAAAAAIRAAIDAPAAGIGPARAYVAERFSWDKAGERLHAVLAQCHAARGLPW